eukprot:gene17919-23539_t
MIYFRIIKQKAGTNLLHVVLQGIGRLTHLINIDMVEDLIPTLLGPGIELQVDDEHDFKPKKILDIGCSTGLSTIKLHETFPNIEIFGIDLSPYMLAVAKQNLESNDYGEANQHIQYIHSKGEVIDINEKQINLVSMCLVLHELPSDISKQIFTQVYDILPNDGVFSIMDMNPLSTHFIKLASNPFAFSAFKSTEPWLQEYVSMDLIETLKYVGFKEIDILYNSPRHRTVVAYK